MSPPGREVHEIAMKKRRPERLDAYLGYLCARSGRRTEARAFEWLDRALDERAPDLFGIAVS